MLAGRQALSMTDGSIVGLTGAIVGNMLCPDKALSTLPIAVQQAGIMTATIPAALLMARIGRRPGFWPRHPDRRHWCGDRDLGDRSRQLRMVLLRHLSAWRQSRRDAAIPLCRRRDRYEAFRSKAISLVLDAAPC
jgi:uncharacterized membrane protein YeaQ/YmgE (transglycosylase-associated protein family)